MTSVLDKYKVGDAVSYNNTDTGKSGEGYVMKDLEGMKSSSPNTPSIYIRLNPKQTNQNSFSVNEKDAKYLTHKGEYDGPFGGKSRRHRKGRKHTKKHMRKNRRR